MFTDFIVQPIFNLLVFIYALVPGHNFGLSLIIFTIVIRLLLWPLVKKQLHQAKAMKKLQPEIKKIKKATKGNRQKESMMLMELYKERGINPFGTIPTLIVQLIILIGLYSGLQKVIRDPKQIVEFAYAPLQQLPWMEQLARNIDQFDETLFGIVDLSRAAIGGPEGFYLAAMLLVIGSAVAQFFQSKQLLPVDKDARGLRAILKEAGSGKQADQSEVNAAVGRSTLYLLPAMIFLFTVNLASVLSLYWLVGGIVAFIQQSIVLGKDETEMEAIADKSSKSAKPGKSSKADKIGATKNVAAIPEAEVVVAAPIPNSGARKSKKSKKEAQAMNDSNDSIEEAIQYGKKYLEDLLSFFGLNTDVYATSDDEVIQLNVPSTHLNGFLIGQRGENMRALQYLTSTALKNNNYANNRVNVDVADYKKQRAERLRERAEEWMKQVKESKEPMDLEPMNAADRRVVHQLAVEYGLSSDSDGEGRDRHIVLKPDASA